MRLSRETLIKMEQCSPLLPNPGPEVVEQLMGHIWTVEAELTQARAESAAIFEQIASNLDKVADGYSNGGHSHRAQMLHGLAEETRWLRTPSQDAALKLVRAQAVEKESDAAIAVCDSLLDGSLEMEELTSGIKRVQYHLKQRHATATAAVEAARRGLEGAK